MKFNFQRKPKTDDYIPIKLNDKPAQRFESQKLLLVILDKHLNFYEHINIKIKICNKLIGTTKHFICSPSEKIFANNLRATTPCGDIIFDKLVNELLINNLGRFQCQACLTITAVTQDTSRKSLYKNLELEFLQDILLQNIKCYKTRILILY